MKHPAPILVADRFPALGIHLIELLGGLTEGDWARPTVAPDWSVKDVAAHLLGGDIGILSRTRDAQPSSNAPVQSFDDLVKLVDRLNAEWVLAARRMSPRVLRELLAYTGPVVEAYFGSLDPMAMGGPVSWAGPEPAPVWFDLAREFTERWHHQQQIRDAVGHQALYDPFFLSPVLDTFVRALPYAFRHTAAPERTVVRLEVTGAAGGAWFLNRAGQQWILERDEAAPPAVDVALDQDVAWRLFTKGIDRDVARRQAVIRGDVSLASPIFFTTSIIG